MEEKSPLSEKLKIARNALGLSQIYIARHLGIAQTNISNLESGHHIRLHPAYLKILADNGINMNSLFDDSIAPQEFEQVCLKRNTLMLPAHEGEQAIDYSNCPKCKANEGLIKTLEKRIEHMDIDIARLERRGEIDLLGEQIKTG